MDGWAARVGLAGAAAALLAGCAMNDGGGDEVRRPVVGVADEVATVQSGMLVGTWRCRELNPYPQLPKASRTFTFDADGTLVAETLTEDDPRYGSMQGTSRGNWSVEGDRLLMKNMTLEAKAAEGNTNPFTGMLTGLTTAIANSFMRDQQDGSFDVLELTGSELALRGIGEDPPVFACTR
jgi:hypothetical protein